MNNIGLFLLAHGFVVCITPSYAIFFIRDCYLDTIGSRGPNREIFYMIDMIGLNCFRCGRYFFI